MQLLEDLQTLAEAEADGRVLAGAFAGDLLPLRRQLCRRAWIELRSEAERVFPGKAQLCESRSCWL